MFQKNARVFTWPGANIAASARAILDDELLGQMVRFPGDSPGDRDTFPYSASPETGATAAE
jgi:hypothetical protein